MSDQEKIRSAGNVGLRVLFFEFRDFRRVAQPGTVLRSEWRSIPPEDIRENGRTVGVITRREFLTIKLDSGPTVEADCRRVQVMTRR